MNAKDKKEFKAKLAGRSREELEAMLKETSATIATKGVSDEDKRDAQAAAELINQALKELDASGGQSQNKSKDGPGMVKVRAGKQPVNVDGIHIGAGETGFVPEKRLASLGNLVTKVACALLLAALCLLGSAASAQTQYDLIAPMGGYTAANTNFVVVTNGTATAVTTNLNNIYGVTRFEEVGVHLRFKLQSGTHTDATSLTWATGGNTNHFATAGPGQGTITVAPNGTTFVDYWTNIYVGSAGYLRLGVYTPSTNANTTNALLEVYGKPKRFGNN